jgi:diaminopimelate decarboxylase
MTSTRGHQLDSSIDTDAAIDSLLIRGSLQMRFAPPAVVPRLAQGLLSATQQAVARAATSPQGSSCELTDGESFLVVDANHAVKKLIRWRETMPGVKPFFAIKCNPDPVLIRSLVAAGQCGFDCASIGEIYAVLQAGSHPSRVIYANPNKAPDAILKALSLGVTTMTFDSVAELTKVRTAVDAITAQGGQGGAPDLVLRLRVPDDHSVFKLGSKFGAEPLQVCVC